jgi:hypothetical protein
MAQHRKGQVGVSTAAPAARHGNHQRHHQHAATHLAPCHRHDSALNVGAPLLRHRQHLGLLGRAAGRVSACMRRTCRQPDLPAGFTVQHAALPQQNPAPMTSSDSRQWQQVGTLPPLSCLHEGAVLAGAGHAAGHPPVLLGRKHGPGQRQQARSGVLGQRQQGGAACRAGQARGGILQ